MKWYVALVFVLLFLVVAAFCLWVEKPFTSVQAPGERSDAPMPQAQSRELPKEEVFSPNLMDLLPGDEIEMIQIQNLEKRKTMTLNRTDGRWRLKFPVRDEASPAKAQGLIQTLLSTQKLQQMKPEKAWDEYGLERPRIKLGIETARKSRRYLYLGAQSPVGNVIFARWEDEETYFLLPANFEEPFLQSVYSFREKKIFTRSDGLVRRIEFESAGEHYELENQGTQWVWKHPEAMRWTACPAGDAEALLDQLRRLFVKDFLENIPEKESGLAEPAKITLWNDADRYERLLLGNEAIVRDAYFARKEGEANTLLVAREKINVFLERFRSLADEQGLGPALAPEPVGEEAA